MSNTKYLIKKNNNLIIWGPGNALIKVYGYTPKGDQFDQKAFVPHIERDLL